MPASIPRCLVHPLYRLRSAVKRYTTLKASGCNLITHFSYHKCLTSYYQSVVRALSAEFGFYYEHFTSDYPRFEQAALNDPRRRVLSVNNRSDIAWERLPEYRGSHFIRDPRDLVVSGYYYHLWTREAWCIDPGFEWRHLVAHPYFGRYVETLPSRLPRAVSYQEYLGTLDRERGMIVELIWRTPHLDEMRRWNFANPRIMELRYEDIIGKEANTFGRLLEHYGFAPPVVARGVALAEAKSIKHRSKSGKSHVRSGAVRQWDEEFTPLLRTLFRECAGDLLVRLGYEASTEW
jgi:Sulfotransferase domain